MVLCDSFTNNVECIIGHSNLLTYKMTVLGLIFIYCVWIRYKSKSVKVDFDQISNYEYFTFLMSNVFSKMYLFFSPFLLVLLRASISFEVFFKAIVIGYMIFLGLGFGAAVLFSKEKIFQILGSRTSNVMREKLKYGSKKN